MEARQCSADAAHEQHLVILDDQAIGGIHTHSPAAARVCVGVCADKLGLVPPLAYTIAY